MCLFSEIQVTFSNIGLRILKYNWHWIGIFWNLLDIFWNKIGKGVDPKSGALATALPAHQRLLVLWYYCFSLLYIIYYTLEVFLWRLTDIFITQNCRPWRRRENRPKRRIQNIIKGKHFQLILFYWK